MEQSWRTIPWQQLEITSRLEGYFKRAGLKTLGDLADCSKQDILSHPNVGRITFNEIQQLIAKHRDAP